MDDIHPASFANDLCYSNCIALYCTHIYVQLCIKPIVSADNLLNDEQNSVVELENHELNEQLMLINQLDEDEKNALIKIINSMLTKKRMKDLLDGKVNF